MLEPSLILSVSLIWMCTASIYPVNYIDGGIEPLPQEPQYGQIRRAPIFPFWNHLHTYPVEYDYTNPAVYTENIIPNNERSSIYFKNFEYAPPFVGSLKINFDDQKEIAHQTEQTSEISDSSSDNLSTASEKSVENSSSHLQSLHNSEAHSQDTSCGSNSSCPAEESFVQTSKEHIRTPQCDLCPAEDPFDYDSYGLPNSTNVEENYDFSPLDNIFTPTPKEISDSSSDNLSTASEKSVAKFSSHLRSLHNLEGHSQDTSCGSNSTCPAKDTFVQTSKEHIRNPQCDHSPAEDPFHYDSYGLPSPPKVKHLKALEVAAIFPSIHFDADNLANELFKLMQEKNINYEAIKQLLSPFSNEQRTDIMNSLTKKANGQKLLDDMLNISPLEIRLILSPMPVSDEEQIFKQWFGLDWNKNSNVISKILKYFSSTEILNFSDLFEQLKQNIEYSITTNANITQEVNLESYKLKPKSVNESQKYTNYADNLKKYLAAPKINEKAIVDLFLANGNDELYSITKLYNKQNKVDLITEIKTHEETQLGNILIALLKSMPDFVTSWLPFSNVNNSTIDKSFFEQMEAAKKAHNALWFDIDLQLRNILKFHIWQSQRLKTLNSFLNEPEKNDDDELCSKNIQDISNAGKTKEKQTIISEMLPLCNIESRLEIANAYKTTHQTDLIANHTPSNASYLNDVAQALLTPFPVLNNDDFLRMLLPNEDLNTKQLNILKYFSFAEIEDVHKAYEQLYLSIESNLKSILQNHIWDNENLIELYNFFNEMAKGPKLKYAMEIYDKWLPSSRTHSLWSRFSYKYLRNLEETCERLRLYLRQRLRLYNCDEYITLDANKGESLNQLILNANSETKHCKDKHHEYVEKLKKTLNLKSDALKANIMEIVMQCDNNDMIEISKLYTKLLGHQLPQSLNNTLPKNYFHDLALSLFAPYPSEYNVESSYKYWLQLWNETEILQNSMQTFKSKLQKIKTAYENMKLTVQKKILFILRNRLWENDVKLGHMLRTIDKMSSGFRLYENEKETKWEQNMDVSLVQRGHNFYPGNDVQTLTTALNGKLLNIRQISNVLINRSYDERMIIAGMEKSLPTQIDNKLTDIFGNIPKALMTSYPVEQAWTLFNTLPLSQLKCTDILKDMKYIVFDHITAFNAADKDVKVFIETEIKKGLRQWRNPKCLKIKTSPSVPSIRPAKYILYSKEDAKKIFKAIPNQVAEIIDILTHRSTDQRFNILVEFYQQNRITLQSKLIKSFERRVKDITSALVMPYGEFVASVIQSYTARNPSVPYGIIDFLATASNHDIQPVKHSHANIYGNSKFDQFYRLVTAPFKGVAVKMVTDIVRERRNEHEVVLDSEVDAEATFLFQLGENKYVRSLQEEERIANIFAKRSRQFLRKLIDFYEITYKECIESAIKERGLHRDLETLVLAIIHATKSTVDYFADRLYEALSGNHIIMDNNLIRIVVTRSQIDLHDIHERFEEKYGKGLLDLIMSKKEDIDYMKALCAIIKPTDETP